MRWLLILTVLAVAAQPADVGTNVGQTLPGPFKAYVAWPNAAPPVEGQTEERQNSADPTRDGKHHCLVTRYGLDPTVAVFLREVPASDDEPAALLLKTLDAKVRDNRDNRLRAFAIFLRLKSDFLTDDARIPEIRSIEQLGTKLDIKDMPLALDQAESPRTAAYQLSESAAVTVIISEQLRVRAKLVFGADRPLDQAGIDAVLAEVAKVIKGS